MKPDAVIAALSALAQENRLAVFRALVQAGPEGLCPSDLADKLRVVGPTLSFHLAQLRHAGLISFERHGRSLLYAANFPTMNALIGFLSENCCGGDLAACATPECRPAVPKPRRRVAGRAS